MFRESDTQIAKLKVRAGRDMEKEDRSALLNRLSFLLDTVNFRPTGIPPSGILFLRRFEDPLPGKIMEDQNSLRVDSRWQQAAGDVLSEKYRQASRPVKGYLPTDAEAVFFIDEGQMLAALLLDMSSGEAPSRWWWQVILQKIKASPDVITILCKEITSLPAVMFHLSQWQAVDRVLDKLSLHQVKTVLSTLSRKYGLDKLLSPIFQQQEITAQKVPVREVKAPWQQWLPHHWFPSAMTGEKEALLGISLSLLRAPAKLPTGSFIKDFRDWWRYRVITRIPGSIKEQEIIAKSSELPYDTIKKPSRTAADRAFQEMREEKPPGLKDSDPAGGDRVEPNNKTVRTLPDSSPQHRELVGRAGDTSATAKKEKIGTRIRFDSGPDKPEDMQTSSAEKIILSGKEETGSPTPGKPLTVDEKKSCEIPAEEGVVTRLGGVFYLINLMNNLGLPDCFEEQCELASRIGAWGVLETLSRALLAGTEQPIASDPLWPVLAGLAGREPGSLPGEDFCCKEDIQLPQQWLQKLQIPAAGLQTNCKSLAKETKQEKSSALLTGFDPHLIRWLNLVLPYIKLYIEHALKPLADKNSDPVITLLSHPAKLYVTVTHVDVVMKLEDISLPVRAAGLDCDPGWMPAFARIILFHYE